MSDMSVTDLFIYPVKSCSCITVKEARIAARGFEHDRRWMLIDENRTSINQIMQPRLACISPSFTSGGLQLQAPQMETLIVPYEPETDQVLTVKVLKKFCEAVVVNTQASHWFSGFLHQPCQLVYMPETTHRPPTLKVSAPSGELFSEERCMPCGYWWGAGHICGRLDCSLMKQLSYHISQTLLK